jgi:hypothetical protein
MDDPRLDETHLHSPRREEYRHAREEVFGAMGSNTGDVEREFHASRLPLGFVPPPAGFALQDMRTGKLHLLRVGINTIGRHPDNDIVLGDIPVSRRHCVILVHASGTCEVRDTASRNGTRRGREPVEQAELRPGDIIRVCDFKFMLRAPPVGEPHTSGGEAPETGDHGRTRSG